LHFLQLHQPVQAYDTHASCECNHLRMFLCKPQSVLASVQQAKKHMCHVNALKCVCACSTQQACFHAMHVYVASYV